uniref:Uncharacterized protein n=1 Tax=Heterosigma akashiwo TaxID=2829 RepID=A0A6V2TU79_HETAK
MFSSSIYHERGRFGNTEHPLGHSNRVLGGATGNVFNLEVSLQLLVNGKMFVFGKDCIVELHIIFLQNFISDFSRDVKERIAHAKNGTISNFAGCIDERGHFYLDAL